MTQTQTQQLDEFESQMCEYFVDLHQRMSALESEMYQQFNFFESMINQLPDDQQKKYKKYINVMDMISDHGGERDLPGNIWYGDEFGSHYLGHHKTFNKDCIYCSDQKNHEIGKHDNNSHEFCDLCEELRSQESKNPSQCDETQYNDTQCNETQCKKVCHTDIRENNFFI